MILRLLSLIPNALRLRSELALENVALRQQLAVLNRQRRRPKLRKHDRLFCVLLSRSWEHWKETLVFVKPETVLRWHRRRFAPYRETSIETVPRSIRNMQENCAAGRYDHIDCSLRPGVNLHPANAVKYPGGIDSLQCIGKPRTV
jgi:hypothetical protein